MVYRDCLGAGARASTAPIFWAYWGNPNDTDVPSGSKQPLVGYAGYQIALPLEAESGFPYADSTGQHPGDQKAVAPTPTAGVVGHGVSRSTAHQIIFLQGGHIEQTSSQLTRG